MIRLPENKGFVELVNEPEVTRPPQSTADVDRGLFLQTDAKSPLSSRTVGCQLRDRRGRREGCRGKKGSAESVPLGAEPKSDDPAGASRFASKPGHTNFRPYAAP